MDLYGELSEYTGLPKKHLELICPYASLALMKDWYNWDGDVTDFYRTTELYIYDLTFYQQSILTERWHDWYSKAVTGTGLDLGGGIGEYTIQACKSGCEMDYVDVADSKTMDYAKWRFAKHGVNPNVYGEDFKIEKDYTFVVAMDVFEHLENPEDRIKEIAEHTKYLFCNPEQVQYNMLYPMHISEFDLSPWFDHVTGNLFKCRTS